MTMSEPKIVKIEYLDSSPVISASAMGGLNIPMSKSSQVDCLPTVCVWLIGFLQVKISAENVFSTSVSSAKTAKSASFIINVLPSDAASSVLGFVSTTGSPTSQSCSTSCCTMQSCLQDCGPGFVCFSMSYYDDVQPTVELLTIAQGPDVGGDFVNVVVHRYPTINSANQLSVTFTDSSGQVLAFGTVFLLYSNDQETKLSIKTPAVNLNGQPSSVFDVSILGPVDLTFQYTYLATSPMIVSGSVIPSQGKSSGGVLVYLQIMYFPFPSQVSVSFAGNLLDTAVTVDASSTALTTILSFVTPETQPGSVLVTVFPSTCPLPCVDAVTFDFVQVSVAQVALLPPVPVSCPTKASLLPPVSLANFPSGYDVSSMVVALLDATGARIALSVDSIQRFQGANVQISINLAPSLSPGQYIVELQFPPVSAVVLTFSIVLYDPTSVRSLGVDPVAVPTSFALWGRSVPFNMVLSVLCANCPQGLKTTDVAAMYDGSMVELLSIRDVATCPPSGTDCNRTSFKVQVSSGVTAGNKTLLFTSNLVKFNLPTQIASLESCDWDSYCSSFSLTSNALMLLDQPSSGLTCSLQFCIAPHNIPDLSILSASPSSGPEAGGTSVKIQLQNLNAIDTSDIIVTCNNQFITVSNFDYNNKIVYISTPPYDGSSRSVLITLKSTGGAVRSASFTFTYVGSGPLTVLAVSLKEVARSMDVDVLDFGVMTAANSIVSSTADSTVAALKVSPFQNQQWTLGYMQVKVFDSSRPGQNEASFRILVVEDPIPTITAMSPTEMDCTVVNSFVLGIKNLPPWARSSDFSVEVGGNAMVINQLQVIGAVATMTLGLNPIPSCKIGPQVLSILSLTDGRMSMNATVTFKAPTSAKLLLFQPSTFYLGQSRDVQIYLENFPSATCVDCVQEAYRSMFVCNGQNGTLKSVQFSQGKAVIVGSIPLFRLPGVISCSLSSPTESVPFQVSLSPPGVTVAPIDGAQSGGSQITIVAVGFDSTRDLTVTVGGSIAEIVSADITWYQQVFPAVRVVAVAPPASAVGTVPCSISSSLALSSQTFSFQYFQPPVVDWARPNVATVSGKTNSADGRSAKFKLSNFPPLSGPEDLLVLFDGIECMGISCFVSDFQTASDQYVVTVRVPPRPSGDKVVSFAYRNVAQSSTIRSARVASIPFQFVKPAPLISSILWCAVCNPGDSCMSYRRCGDASSPRVSEADSNGNGVLILVVEHQEFGASSSASASLNNVAYLQFQRVAFAAPDGSRLELEFKIPQLSMSGLFSGQLTLNHLGLTVNIPFQVNLFNSQILISCFDDQYAICAGSFLQPKPVQVRLSNFPFSQGGLSFIDSVAVTFGYLQVRNLRRHPYGVGADPCLQATSSRLVRFNTTEVVLEIQPPTCSNCLFANGKSSVDLSVALRADSSIKATTTYTYWKAPDILSSSFGSQGISISVLFDQVFLSPCLCCL
eukprot:767847-Hanusia_phi.AAC.4